MNWNWNVSAQRVMMLNHIPGGLLRRRRRLPRPDAQLPGAVDRRGVGVHALPDVGRRRQAVRAADQVPVAAGPGLHVQRDRVQQAGTGVPEHHRRAAGGAAGVQGGVPRLGALDPQVGLAGIGHHGPARVVPHLRLGRSDLRSGRRWRGVRTRDRQVPRPAQVPGHALPGGADGEGGRYHHPGAVGSAHRQQPVLHRRRLAELGRILRPAAALTVSGRQVGGAQDRDPGLCRQGDAGLQEPGGAAVRSHLHRQDGHLQREVRALDRVLGVAAHL